MNRFIMSFILMLVTISIFCKLVQTKVIVSVFAGREQYMHILHQYLDFMLYSLLIDEVHLWDFTTKDEDKAYLKSLLRHRSQYKLYLPDHGKADLSMNFFRSYYEYYANPENLRKNDVLMKLDDDIVYIDPTHFMHYIRTIHISKSLVFPNIINNAICAFMQAKNKVHNLTSLFNRLPFPLELHSNYANENVDFNFINHTCGPATDWFKNGALALQIHRMFLSDPGKFVVDVGGNYIYKGRMSINFFGGTAEVIQQAFHTLLWSKDDGDESFLSCDLRHVTGLGNKIVPNVVVSHFAYQMQRKTKGTKDDFDEILSAYHQLANKTIGSYV